MLFNNRPRPADTTRPLPTFTKLKRFIHFLIIILLISATPKLFAEVTVDFVNAPWNDKIGANTPRSVRWTNNTPDLHDVKGVRFSVPENTAMKTGTMDGSTKLKANDPWHNDRRYDVKLKSAIKAGTTSGATVKGGGAIDKAIWTPYEPQMLVKTRSFADMADFVDANPVTIDQIDSIIRESSFYDKNLYVSDTLGENAPLFGAGFIDTYIKQKDSTPITQVQMNEFPEDLYIKLSIGYNVKYRPDLMGENDKVPGKDNGPGPLYSMGLVAAQELMHIDQQFLAPMGIIETQAAFEAYGVMGDGSIGARLGMTHIQKNSPETGMGPMHMEGTGFAEKAFDSYPSFFPYANGGNPQQWFTTPGTATSGNAYGSCTGNSAQIVNATMLATLYCWRGYEQLFRATDFYAKGIFEDATDRKLAAKLYMWGWQAGFSTAKGGTYSGPLYWNNIKDITDITPQTSDYVKKVMPALDGILNAQMGSKLNGGNCKVIDIPITLEYIAEFFYGNDTAPYNSISFAQNGNLGKGGILQHWELTTDERKQLWSDLESAFNKMKGKAPSGYSDAVSFRYDWLTLLRIAKGYIYPQMFDVPFKPVMLPTPTDIKFTNWINIHSTENNIPDIPVKDTTFPNLKIQNMDIASNGDFQITLRGGDNIAVDIDDPITAEWSIDPNWRRWMPGEYLSGTKTDAEFLLTIPVDTIQAKFGDKDGQGWVRITDKSGNSTIDTITIGGIPYPKVDSVFITDPIGNGIGREINVYLTKGGSDDADALADWDEIKYSWPDQSSFETAQTGQVTLNGSVLTITEENYTDGAGLGLLELSYPSKKNYGGDIVDRVGPALVNKANLYASQNGSDPDTLAVKLSEVIEGVKNSGAQLAFTTDKSDSTAEAHVEIISISEDSIRFLFDAKKLIDANYAWVKMEITSGITDKVPDKNRPLDKNQWIPIVDNRAKYPTLDSAQVFDYNGDGAADSVRIFLTKSQSAGAYDLDAYTDLNYSWPGTGAADAVSATVVDGGTLRFGDLSNDDPAGLGELSILYADMAAAANCDIDDYVGPVLTNKAELYASGGSTPDTLAVKLNESITGTVNSGTQLAFSTDKSDSSAEAHVELLSISQDTVRFLFDAKKLTDANYAWVKLIRDGGITDQAPHNNRPNENSQWVPLVDKRAKYPTLDSAEVFDNNGDGTADSVRIYLTKSQSDEAYEIDSYSSLKYSWPGTGATDAVSATILEGTTLLFGDLSSSAPAGLGELAIMYADMSEAAKTDINDRVGPVITSATLSIEDGSRDKDTLYIQVSEALGNFSAENTIYTYLKKGNDEQPEESESIKQVDPLTYKVIYARDLVIDKDSVKFHVDGLTDRVDNKPHVNNQRIEIIKIGGKEPVISEAAIYDINGNGRGDSVAVRLSLGSAADKFTTAHINDGAYSWPGTSMDKSLASVDLTINNESNCSFKYDSKSTNGIGRLKLNFPENYSTEKEINDKVGPVIDSAICFQIDTDRDYDTLLLEVSESLKANFSSKKYLILFENEADSEGDTVLVSSVTEKDGNYLFTVAKDAVSYGDWVQFVYDSGIEDMVGNRPLAINQKVLINVKGNVAPTLTIAEIHDVYGEADRLDGHGDSIFVELTLTDDPNALTVDSLESVSYIWNGMTKSINKDELIHLSENSFAIVDKGLLGGAGTGTVSLSFIKNYIVEGTIEDKVAPVLISATYFNWSSSTDTLTAIFSEELNSAGNSTPLIKSGDVTLTLKKVNHTGVTVIYSIEGSDEITFGDSLWVKGNQEVTDLANNEQATDDNQRVLVNYTRVTELTGAQYIESDDRPDGYIDEIILTFADTVDESIEDILKGTIKLPTERSLSIEDIKIDEKEVTLFVKQDKAAVEANSAVVDSDTLLLPYCEGTDTLALVSDGSVMATDGMAPVIISARFLPAGSKTDGKLIDTLRLSYSEEVVKKTTDEPFIFSDADDNDREYVLSFDGNNKGKTDVDYYYEYDREKPLPNTGDSIWISDNGEITDIENIEQQRNSIAVPLTVGKYPPDYQVAVAPIPFDMRNFGDSVITFYILPGTRRLPDDLTATAVIYDKVGNVIKKISAEEFGEVVNEQLTYDFSPQNEVGRKLGEGTYPVIIIVTANGDRERYDRYLGIRGMLPGESLDDDEKESDE